MKLLATLLAFCAGTADAKPAPRAPSSGDPLDPDRMLRAIEQAENTPYYKVGRDGERSSYQITRAVWEKYSGFPFADASSNRLVARAEARRVARCHLDWLRVQLAQWEMPDRPYWVALAWNGGIGAVVGNASPAKRDFASRCHQLYFAP